MQSLNTVIANPSGLDSLSNYIGESDIPGFDCLLTQNRDSDALTRSNFISALEMLGGESDNVQIFRFGHWACGWWEALTVKRDTPEYKIALDIESGLEDYPVVNEAHWSELEFNEACDYWASMGVRERFELCKRFGISPFASRREYLPQDENGSLLDYLASN
jgi:hypothetical protein